MIDDSRKLKPGTQIAYIPDHAMDNLAHPDVEYGFVTSDKGENAFCRYWWKTTPSELRTRSCSELTPKRNLVMIDSHDQRLVDRLMREIQVCRGFVYAK